MQDKSETVVFFRERFKLFGGRRETGPVWLAASLLVIAVLLFVVVAGTIKYNAANQFPAPYGEVASAPESVGEPEKPAGMIPRGPVTAPAENLPLATTAPAAEKAADQAPALPGRRPVAGKITAGFGWQFHPRYQDWRYNNGVDIEAPGGQTVKAVFAGRVAEVYNDRTAGLTVMIVSNDYTVYYGSLDRIGVREGMKVTAGDPVGWVGTSNSEPYPHLHLAIKKGGRYLDPAGVME